MICVSYFSTYKWLEILGAGLGGCGQGDPCRWGSGVGLRYLSFSR